MKRKPIAFLFLQKAFFLFLKYKMFKKGDNFYCYKSFSNSLILSLISAAFSNSIEVAYLSISSVNSEIVFLISSAFSVLYSTLISSCLVILIVSRTDFDIVVGVISFFRLYSYIIFLIMFV